MSYLGGSLDAFADEMVKIGAELTVSSRSKIKTKSFALPDERRYPIHDEQHARSALGFVAMHGSAEEKARVHAAVAKKYPGLEKTAGMFSRIGKGIAGTLDKSKMSRGVVAPAPSLPAAPQLDVSALRDAGRKALMGAGALGIGAAGGAYAMHQADQNNLKRLTGG